MCIRSGAWVFVRGSAALYQAVLPMFGGQSNWHTRARGFAVLGFSSGHVLCCWWFSRVAHMCIHHCRPFPGAWRCLFCAYAVGFGVGTAVFGCLVAVWSMCASCVCFDSACVERVGLGAPGGWVGAAAVAANRAHCNCVEKKHARSWAVHCWVSAAAAALVAVQLARIRSRWYRRIAVVRS